MKTVETLTDLQEVLDASSTDVEFVALWQEAITGEVKSSHIRWDRMNKRYVAMCGPHIKWENLVPCFAFVLVYPKPLLYGTERKTPLADNGV